MVTIGGHLFERKINAEVSIGARDNAPLLMGVPYAGGHFSYAPPKRELHRLLLGNNL